MSGDNSEESKNIGKSEETDNKKAEGLKSEDLKKKDGTYPQSHLKRIMSLVYAGPRKNKNTSMSKVYAGPGPSGLEDKPAETDDTKNRRELSGRNESTPVMNCVYAGPEEMQRRSRVVPRNDVSIKEVYAGPAQMGLWNKPAGEPDEASEDGEER